MTARTLLPQPPLLMTLLQKSPQTEQKFRWDCPSCSPVGVPVSPLFILLGRFSSIMGALSPPPPHRPTVEHELRSTQWRLPLDPPPSPPLLRRSHPCFTRGSYRRANQSRRFFFVILSSRGGNLVLPGRFSSSRGGPRILSFFSSPSVDFHSHPFNFRLCSLFFLSVPLSPFCFLSPFSFLVSCHSFIFPLCVFFFFVFFQTSH